LKSPWRRKGKSWKSNGRKLGNKKKVLNCWMALNFWIFWANSESESASFGFLIQKSDNRLWWHWIFLNRSRLSGGWEKVDRTFESKTNTLLVCNCDHRGLCCIEKNTWWLQSDISLALKSSDFVRMISSTAIREIVRKSCS
jgi:hypothetical protein